MPNSPANRRPSLRGSLRSLCAAGALAVSLGSTAAYATPIVDRENGVAVDQASFLCGGSCNWQQTITAGRTGQLVGITLYGAGGTGELRIGLGDGYYTGPWVADLQDAAIDGGMIDLRSYNIFLTAGQVFVADVLNGSDSIFGTANTFGDTLWFSNAEWGLEGFPWDGSLAYTTYIDAGSAAPVPLAPAWAMLAIGFAAWAAAQRARKASGRF